MSDFKVRFATLQEATAVAQLHLQASQAAYAGQVPDAHWDATPKAKRIAYWKEAIEFSEPQVMVATEGSSIVGLVGFDRSRDPKSKNTMGEIWAIYADPNRLGQGIGLALWDAAREGLLEEGCTDVSVWVPLRNDRSVRFHELAGFKREMNTARTVPLGGVKIEEVRLKRSLAG
ncbi:MAG: GNAT family N-acetyltransferase [Betaproteobacteria bacterium]|jgi:GNAT superfamily N-acetyltransferase|nr:GNAT family N-acetyltransferase [Burkholderiales bacterium]NBX13842.1 GNAT family N-acetyltransferase [Betaproteobacteria bacterium]NBX90322.1 GNAT family N-acetyltransferase [Betaproteobacteria bacterium]